MSNPHKLILFVECLLLFFVAPASLYLFRHHLAFRIIWVVMVLAIFCAAVLWKSPAFETRRLFSLARMGSHGKAILATFVLPAAMMTVYAWFFLHERFVSFPAERPKTWLIFFFLYPILAAFPQEVVFRAFFFHRYRKLFAHPAALILASSASFSLAHFLYANPVAPALSFFGGLLFSWRYWNTGSLPAAAFEHGLWGNFLFTVGIGWFFYSGAIQ